MGYPLDPERFGSLRISACVHQAQGRGRASRTVEALQCSTCSIKVHCHSSIQVLIRASLPQQNHSKTFVAYFSALVAIAPYDGHQKKAGLALQQKLLNLIYENNSICRWYTSSRDHVKFPPAACRPNEGRSDAEEICVPEAAAGLRPCTGTSTRARRLGRVPAQTRIFEAPGALGTAWVWVAVT